jgi:hypothetical protein
MLIPVGFGYVSAVLRRLAREQDARARDNEVRDIQRGEILENVRRIANGKAVVHPTARLTSGAHRANKGRRRAPRRAAEIERGHNYSKAKFDDLPPTEEPETLQGE